MDREETRFLLTKIKRFVLNRCPACGRRKKGEDSCKCGWVKYSNKLKE
jgi:hypothetical protein